MTQSVTQTRSEAQSASRGPWSVGEVLDTRTFEGEAVNVILVRRGGHTDIAYVAHMSTDGDTSEQHANARLIACAPELLAVLHEGRRAIGDHFAPNDCYATGPLTGDAIRDLVQCPACSFIAAYDAIIAKAEGRS